jgi:GMP synthase PP-ATPase subunit
VAQLLLPVVTTRRLVGMIAALQRNLARFDAALRHGQGDDASAQLARTGFRQCNCIRPDPNEVPKIDRVVFDAMSKPPGTIE